MTLLRHPVRSALFVAVVSMFAAAGCQPVVAVRTDPPPATALANADTAFAALSTRWLDGMLELSPISATGIGEHRYDTRIDDLSAAGRARSLDFSKRTLAELEAIDRTALSRENQVDAAILRNQLRYDIWSAETLQSWAWDPQAYSGLAGGAVYSLMAREFAPLPGRMQSAIARMEQLPTLFKQMRENIVPARVPKTHAETVAKQNAGVMSVIEQMVLPNAATLSPTDRERLDRAVAGLRTAVAEHQTWLDKTLVPNAKGDFRLGKALYDQKLAFALDSPLSRAEIRSRAEAELTRVRAQMYDVARGVLRDRKGAPALPDAPTPAQQQKAIEAALELAYAQKPPRDKVVEMATAATEQATAFVRAKDLVTVPDTPVKIILMPEFQRGFAVAYADSPGPLDKGLDTYYAISPIPDDWTATQVDSFLREYNSRMLHVLSIHEAMPGHYLEGWHSAKHPSMLRSVLRSGLFAEGWAVYTEHVMADAGYLDNDPLFRLVQLKFYLRAIANALLDQGVHVDNWTREQSMDLMVNKTFQQEREAAGKWTRMQLSSAQLPTYFVGVQEHFDLRRAVEQREGASFNAKRYHDAVLSHGAPPVRYVRQLMLGEAIR